MIITATVVFDQASCLTIKYTGINISTDWWKGDAKITAIIKSIVFYFSIILVNVNTTAANILCLIPFIVVVKYPEVIYI